VVGRQRGTVSRRHGMLHVVYGMLVHGMCVAWEGGVGEGCWVLWGMAGKRKVGCSREVGLCVMGGGR